MNAGENRGRGRRAILLPLGAVMLGFLLLLTWINALAANGHASENLQTPAFDLQIVKSQLPTFFGTGSNNHYFINVSRTNTETIGTTILIEDDLPAGLTWTPQNTVHWNCTDTSTATKVSCYYTENDPATFDQLVIPVALPASPTEIFTNTARLLTPDHNPSNNISRVKTILDTAVDLGIRKTVSPTSASTNQDVVYTLIITNAGPAVATNIVVTDHIPLTLTYVTHTASVGTYTPATHRWEIPSLPPNAGSPPTLRITCTIPPNAANIITNQATVSSAETDWAPANNTASASLVVGGISITKSFRPTDGSANPIRVGEHITYTLHVQTSGSAFSGVLVTDTLQPGLDFVSMSPGFPRGSYDQNTRIVRYDRGTLGASQSFDLNIVVRPSSSILSTQPITNVANLSWVVSNQREYKQSSEVEVYVAPGATLQMSKSDGVSIVTPGQSITYTISITNVGNLRVNSGLYVEDTLPQYMTPVSIQANNLGTGSCNTTTRVCSLEFANALPAGQNATFRISARVNADAPSGRSLMNTVIASGFYQDEFNRPQPLSASASDTDTVRVLPTYDLSAGKSVTPAQAKVDESFTFRIQLRNEGTVTIPDIVVKDTFPSVLDLTSVTTNRGTATLNTTTRSINVDVGDLTPGQGARIDVVAKVNSTATKVETYENRARVEFEGVTMHTNTIRFRVLPAATLPGTGWAPPAGEGEAAVAAWLNAAVGQMASQSPLSATQALLSVGLLMLLLGLLALLGSFLIRLRHPLRGGGTARLGLLLILLGVVFSVAGWAFNSSGEAQPPQLSMLAGAKPALATRMPPTATPTNRPTDTQTAAELQPPPTDTEVPAPILPTVTIDLSDLVDFHPTPTPNALPSYPIPTPTAYPTRGPGGVEPDASAATRLLIPSIGLDTVIKYVPFNGDTWLIGGLKQEIAWMGNTSWPGLGGNTGLAGHVDLADGSAGPFWKLKDLKPGDKVIVYTQKNILTYTVSEQRVVEDYDLSVVAPSEQPQITLITCTAWDNELRTYLKRLVVFATLLNVQPLAAGGS
jgi:LPXTG-site transpeptidase (sortase) family protein